MTRKTVLTWSKHALFIAGFIGLWEAACAAELLDPTFFGRPSGIAAYLWKGFITDGKLWLEVG